jgi:hypothetical protein
MRPSLDKSSRATTEKRYFYDQNPLCSKNKPDMALAAGEIVGVVFGVLAFVGFVALYYYWNRKTSTSQSPGTSHHRYPSFNDHYSTSEIRDDESGQAKYGVGGRRRSSHHGTGEMHVG